MHDCRCETVATVEPELLVAIVRRTRVARCETVANITELLGQLKLIGRNGSERFYPHLRIRNEQLELNDRKPR